MTPRSELVSPLLSRHGAVRGSGPDAGVAWHYGDPTAEQPRCGPAAPSSTCLTTEWCASPARIASAG